MMAKSLSRVKTGPASSYQYINASASVSVPAVGQSELGMILGLRPAHERRPYFVTTSLIGWAQAYNQPWAIQIIRWYVRQQ